MAVSKLAFFVMYTGFLPPSSMQTGDNCSAAALQICLAAFSPPVKNTIPQCVLSSS